MRLGKDMKIIRLGKRHYIVTGIFDHEKQIVYEDISESLCRKFVARENKKYLDYISCRR